MDGYVSVSHCDSVIHFCYSHFKEFIQKKKKQLNIKNNQKSQGRIKSNINLKLQKNIGVSFTRKDYFSLYISKCHAYFPCYWLFFVATCEIYEQFLSENYLSFYQCSFGQKICLGPGNPNHCPPGYSNFNITVHLTQRNLKVTRLDF